MRESSKAIREPSVGKNGIVSFEVLCRLVTAPLAAE